MNPKTLRFIAAIPDIPMLLNSFGFALDLGKTAMSLGMPLLDGLARSTQIGDIGAFFLPVTKYVLPERCSSYRQNSGRSQQYRACNESRGAGSRSELTILW
jgi:hypothetical protein